MEEPVKEPGGADSSIVVSIIVPARNEESCLAPCLQSLIRQTGVDFEILVVDDNSSDRTADIAKGFGVRVISAATPTMGHSGKCNAAQTGADVARGEWLLFTDADTVHEPGSLAAAVAEAVTGGVALLSYSPKQEVKTFWEKALMPVIFAELAKKYRPAEINSPASQSSAANGQYLLVQRAAYYACGGHASVAGTLLEDVALARAIKQSGRRIRFRFGGEAVRTRMYRGFTQMREGWTKNLALLFPHASNLAMRRGLEFLAMTAGISMGAVAAGEGSTTYAAVAMVAAVLIWLRFLIRIRAAHFGWGPNLLAVAGLPVFVYLLLRSDYRYRNGKSITWKGREYKAPGGLYATQVSPAVSPARGMGEVKS
jgi:hypothetical protein